jgi:hypothetical protein
MDLRKFDMKVGPLLMQKELEGEIRKELYQYRKVWAIWVHDPHVSLLEGNLSPWWWCSDIMRLIKVDPAPARQFLVALYQSFLSQSHNQKAYLEVRGKAEGGPMSFRRFYRSPEALLKDLPRWKPGLHYWVGVALRKDTQAGKKENLLALTAAFVDVDVGAAGHKGIVKYQDKPAALAAIEAFPLRPSILIDSGGGYQCYWLFQEPVSLAAGGDARPTIERLEGINRALALALGGDVAATDAARILRLPGTFNMKIPGNPRPVEIVWCEPERVYYLAAFAEYEAKGRAPAGRDRRPTGAPGPTGIGQTAAGEYAAYGQKALAAELAELAGAQEGERNARLNQAAFALGQLLGAGVLGRSSVEAGLSGTAAAIGLGEAEARATIKSGLDAGIKEPRALPEKARKGDGGPRRGGTSGPQGEGPQGGQEGPETKKILWLGYTYFVERGRLCLENYDRKGMPYTVNLANFQARITEEITRDDGLRKGKEFCITGSLDTGQPLPLAQITAKEYDSLGWVRREWGAWASVAPGRSHGPHLVNALQAHSRGFKRRSVYAHSGWRQIGGVWRYLHGGGAIGPGEPVEVDLGENLGNYHLPSPGGVEAARASLRFLDVGPWEITAPLLACVYLAPFADLLKVDFSLWIFGPTGGYKSTLSALALCHYGKFDRLTLPGSWLSTVNSLEKLCFTLKDSLVVVDDFIPGGNAREAHVLSERAARIIYQAGNRSGRGRLAPDLTARPNYYPRGLIVSTGEVLLPGQRQSATARYLGMELDPKESPIDKARLTVAQAGADLYAAALAAYLEDLAPRLEEALAEIKELWANYRTAFQNGAHARLPEVQAWLAVGFEFFLRFQTRMGAISQDTAGEMLDRAWKIFEGLGAAHARRIEGERPALKFVSVLRELLITGRVYAKDASSRDMAPPGAAALGWAGTEPVHNAFLVGYADEDMLYLLPETAFRAVSEAVRAQGDYLSLGKNEMLTALAREGFIEPGKDGKNTRVKWIQGGLKRVIFLPHRMLAHDEAAEDEQKWCPGLTLSLQNLTPGV